MQRFGEILSQKRKSRNLSVKKVSEKLFIKEAHIQALEKEDWQNLPEATFTKGYIATYAQFLGLDVEKMLALYRREYDERKYPPKHPLHGKRRSFFLTPARLRNAIFMGAVAAFIIYITVQYSSVFSAPHLELFQPQDDITVSVTVVEISGKAEKEATVSIEGEFVPIDAEGSFSYFYNLEEGKNTIEVIAAKRLSPKSKVTRTVRLIH